MQTHALFCAGKAKFDSRIALEEEENTKPGVVQLRCQDKGDLCVFLFASGG